MALDIAGGIYSRLAADATLVAMLGEYTPEGGVAGPAMLTDPPPENLEIGVAPVVIVAEPYANAPADDFSSRYRRAALNVRLYSKPNGSSADLLAASERVRTLLHNWSAPAFSTGSLLSAFVNGPTPAPTDDPSIEGRILSVQLLIKE